MTINRLLNLMANDYGGRGFPKANGARRRILNEAALEAGHRSAVPPDELPKPPLRRLPVQIERDRHVPDRIHAALQSLPRRTGPPRPEEVAANDRVILRAQFEDRSPVALRIIEVGTGEAPDRLQVQYELPGGHTVTVSARSFISAEQAYRRVQPDLPRLSGPYFWSVIEGLRMRAPEIADLLGHSLDRVVAQQKEQLGPGIPQAISTAAIALEALEASEAERSPEFHP